MFAQQTQWNYSGSTTPCLPANATWEGRVGIGFNNPQSLLHVHSMYCPTNGSVTSAIERLQTFSPEDAFGVSSFQFWSNSVGSGQDWMVGAIEPITMSSFPVFNATNTGNWFGGLAFFCSGSNQRPQANDKIEVMRLYDRKVGINTTEPKGALDIVTSPLTFKNRIIFDAGGDCIFDEGVAKNNFGPRIKFYRPTGTMPTGTEFPNAMSAWINLEFDVPTELGRSRFNIFTTGVPLTVGTETETDMKRRLSITGSGNIGIGQIMPDAKLHITNGALLVEGAIGGVPQKWTFAQTPDPTDGACVGPWTRSELGAGTRLMWIPEKAAFRAGAILEPGSFTPPNANKFWESANIGLRSIAMGENTRATARASGAFGSSAIVKGNLTQLEEGHASFALGHNLEISGSDAFLAGYSNICTGDYSGGIGSFLGLFSHYSYGFGSFITIGDSSDEDIASESFAAGRDLQIDAPYTVTFGQGAASNAPLINDIAQSFMVGFNTNVPTFFVGKSRGLNVWGGVGIATTEPLQWRLRVNTTPKSYDHDNDDNYATPEIIETGVLIGRDDWLIGGNPPSPSENCDLAVQRRVGIGTPSPQEALSVIGGSAIIWNDANVSVATDVDLAVRQKVLIGRNVVFDPTDNTNITNQPHMLQVGGRAIKNDGDGEWDNPSDVNLKKDIETYSDGLKMLRNIQPVWYTYKNGWGLTDEKRNVGVLAQDVRKVLPYTVREDTIKLTRIVKPEKRYEVDAVDTTTIKVPDYTRKDEHGHYEYKDSIVMTQVKRWVIEPTESIIETNPILTFNGSSLKYLLINSVKELDTAIIAVKENLEQTNKRLTEVNDSLSMVVKQLNDRISRIEASVQIPVDESVDVILEQNNPNPFADQTIITYYVPNKVIGTPELIIASTSQSPVLQRMTLVKGMPTQLVVSAKELYTGVFVYSIVANNKVLATKKFIIIK